MGNITLSDFGIYIRLIMHTGVIVQAASSKFYAHWLNIDGRYNVHVLNPTVHAGMVIQI